MSRIKRMVPNPIYIWFSSLSTDRREAPLRVALLRRCSRVLTSRVCPDRQTRKLHFLQGLVGRERVPHPTSHGAVRSGFAVAAAGTAHKSETTKERKRWQSKWIFGTTGRPWTTLT